MTTPRSVDSPLGDVTLSGDRWDGAAGRDIVLLHAGVCDSRSWQYVVPELTDLGTVWAYDRPGFGGTPLAGPRDHVANAVEFLDANAVDRPWLVGSSLGGAVALDVTLVRPERVAGLVLLAPGITGAPPSRLTATEQQLGTLIEDAIHAGDVDEANRYETWFWLDGPDQPEGRVGGAARVLALEMNRTILGHGTEEQIDESVDAWHRLGDLALPVTVAVGDLDASFVAETARHLATAVDGADFVQLTGTAHLPYLDDPGQVVSVVRTALR